MFPRTRLLNFGRHFSRQTRSVATTSGATVGIAPRALRPRLALLGGTGLAVLMWAMPSASCAEDESKKPESDADKSLPHDEIDRFLRVRVYPLCSRLGFGGIMGFCSGIAVKRVGETIAYLVGVVFIGLQVAQYNGLIDIDWLKIRDTGK